MSEWISVEDKLPREDTLVVGADHSYTNMMPDAAVFWFLHGRFSVWLDGLEAENYDGGATIRKDMEITHWMPLPEPPK